MTTYSYSITINDSQRIALEAALRLMIEHCETKLQENAGAPYWAHRQSCEEMLERLRHSKPTMTSTNNFGNMRSSDK